MRRVRDDGPIKYAKRLAARAGISWSRRSTWPAGLTPTGPEQFDPVPAALPHGSKTFRNPRPERLGDTCMDRLADAG